MSLRDAGAPGLVSVRTNVEETAALRLPAPKAMSSATVVALIEGDRSLAVRTQGGGRLIVEPHGRVPARGERDGRPHRHAADPAGAQADAEGRRQRRDDRRRRHPGAPRRRLDLGGAAQPGRRRRDARRVRGHGPVGRQPPATGLLGRHAGHRPHAARVPRRPRRERADAPPVPRGHAAPGRDRGLRDGRRRRAVRGRARRPGAGLGRAVGDGRRPAARRRCR